MVKMRYGTNATPKKKQNDSPTPTTPTAIGVAALGTSRATVDIGFKPKCLCVWAGDSRNAISTYNADWSTTRAYYSGASTSSTAYTMSSNTTNYRLHEITNTGFTVNKASQATTMMYFAIGYAPGEQ